MNEENSITDADDFAEPTEELDLYIDSSFDPEAVWEWDGQAWVAAAD